MGGLLWLLQWPIRAVILLLVAQVRPLGVEMASFGTALLSAITIALLGTLLIWPLKLLLGPVWAVTTLFGILPLSWLFNWLISIILFGLGAWLIQGFRLRNGLVSAILGALVYSILSSVTLKLLGLEVPLTRAMALASQMG
jgi:putative membrane protein